MAVNTEESREKLKLGTNVAGSESLKSTQEGLVVKVDPNEDALAFWRCQCHGMTA